MLVFVSIWSRFFKLPTCHISIFQFPTFAVFHISHNEPKRLTISYVNQRLYDSLQAQGLIQDNGLIQDTTLTQEDYERLLLNPKTARMLEEVGVDPVGIVDFTEFLFKKGDVPSMGPREQNPTRLECVANNK